MPNFQRSLSAGDIETPQPVFQFVDTAISGVFDLVKGIPGTLYSVQVDNSLNSIPCYLQIYDNISPSIGTTAADEILLCPPFVITTASYITSANLGKVFSNAITVAATNILTGAVGPSAAVSVTILYQ